MGSRYKMKHQQVVVDYWTMLKTSCTCLLLAASGYVLIKMVQTIFYLPSYLKSNQKRLEELAVKYNLDLENDVAATEIEELSKNIESEENSLQINKNEALTTEPKKVK